MESTFDSIKPILERLEPMEWALLAEKIKDPSINELFLKALTKEPYKQMRAWVQGANSRSPWIIALGEYIITHVPEIKQILEKELSHRIKEHERNKNKLDVSNFTPDNSTTYSENTKFLNRKGLIFKVSIVFIVICLCVILWYFFRPQNSFDNSLHVVVLNYGEPELSRRLAQEIKNSDPKIHIEVNIKDMKDAINIDDAKKIGFAEAQVVMWTWKEGDSINLCYLGITIDSIPYNQSENKLIIKNRIDEVVFRKHKIKELNELFKKNNEIINLFEEKYAINLCIVNQDYGTAVDLLRGNKINESIFLYALYKSRDSASFERELNHLSLIKFKERCPEKSIEIDSIFGLNLDIFKHIQIKSLFYMDIARASHHCGDMSTSDLFIRKAYHNLMTDSCYIGKKLILDCMCKFAPYFYTSPREIIDTLVYSNIILIDQLISESPESWGYILDNYSSFKGTSGYETEVCSKLYKACFENLITLNGFKFLWGEALIDFILENKLEIALIEINNLKTRQENMHKIIIDPKILDEFKVLTTDVKFGKCANYLITRKISDKLFLN